MDTSVNSKIIQQLYQRHSVESIQIKPDWGSRKVGARTQIREHIDRNLRIQNRTATLSFIERPVLVEGYVSITHCDDFGGYVFSKYPVGIDVELVENVTPRISRGIAALTDSDTDAPIMWSAKEAIFKSICEDKQPGSLSQISVEMRNRKSDLWTFVCSNAEKWGVQELIGTVLMTSRHTWALFSYPRDK